MTIPVDEALLALVERRAKEAEAADRPVYAEAPSNAFALVRHIRAQAEHIAKLEAALRDARDHLGDEDGGVDAEQLIEDIDALLGAP